MLEVYPTDGSTTAAPAFANASYFGFILTPNAGISMSLNGLQFDAGKGGSSDPRSFFVRSSVDNFATDLSNVVLPSGAAQRPETYAINLSSPVFQNRTTTTTLRIYIYTPDTRNNSVDFRNVSISGTTAAVSAAPEPGTLALLAMAALPVAGVAVRRRRQREA